VAIKVIKLGMSTKEVIARFESERQALASGWQADGQGHRLRRGQGDQPAADRASSLLEAGWDTLYHVIRDVDPLRPSSALLREVDQGRRAFDVAPGSCGPGHTCYFSRSITEARICSSPGKGGGPPDRTIL
jgi:hypothetical protein